MDENKTKAFLDKKYADLTKGVLVEQSASIDQEPIAVTKEDEDGDFICELNISPPDYILAAGNPTTLVVGVVSEKDEL